MLNVQALTTTLSAMSLPQLQQYAAMHKTDPYVVTMALSIANQKKQAMTAQQGQAGQQPMPKVVDQDIAQIAPRAAPMPENVGIGQLPAQNIQNMCGGGIVAFGEGGDVPRYQVGGVMGDLPGYQPQGTFSPQAGAPEEPTWARRKIMELQNKVAAGTATPQEKAWVALFGSTKPSVSIAQQDPFAYAQPEQPAAPATTAAPVNTAAAPGTTPPSAPGAVRPQTQPPVRQAAPAAQGAQPAQAGLQSLITDPAAMQKALETATGGIKPTVPTEIASGISDLQRAQETAANQNVSAIEAEQKGRGLAFKDFEERLKEREGRLTKSEEQLGPLALLQAGLAIMGGASPFAAVNIGAGAQVGVKAYTEGADKLERAREKMDESYAKIEEIRRSESRMDAKELRDARQAALQPAIEAKKLGISALEKDWGLKHQDAVKGVELLMQNQRSAYEQAEQTRRTGMQIAAQKEIAAALPGEARVAMMLGTGKTDAERYASGAKMLQELAADKSGMKAVEVLAGINAKERMIPGAELTTMADLLSMAKQYSTLMYPKVADVPNVLSRQ